MEKKSNYRVVEVLKSDKDRFIAKIEFEGKNYLLKRIVSGDENLINMLKNEVVSLQKLQDTSIAPKLYKYEFGQENYILTEFIEGSNISQSRKSEISRIILLVMGVIDALQIIHKHGIIHCDIKPNNIIVNLMDDIVLIDFGISVNEKSNQSFSNYGSVEYCSKEQVLKGKLTENTDMYSLGIVFYALLYEKNPFGETRKEIFENKQNDKYSKATNEMLDSIFSKLFETDNAKRYNNLSEFKKDLEILLNVLNRIK